MKERLEILNNILKDDKWVSLSGDLFTLTGFEEKLLHEVIISDVNDYFLLHNILTKLNSRKIPFTVIMISTTIIIKLDVINDNVKKIPKINNNHTNVIKIETEKEITIIIKLRDLK